MNDLEINNTPQCSVIHLAGYVDAATVEKIKPMVNAELPEGCTQLIIDLENVDFLDSHGVGFFVSLLKRVNAKLGKFFFSGAKDQPASVLSMVGFNSSIVTYCENVEQAKEIISA